MVMLRKLMEINGHLHHTSLAFWNNCGKVNYWLSFAGLSYHLVNLEHSVSFCTNGDNVNKGLKSGRESGRKSQTEALLAVTIVRQDLDSVSPSAPLLSPKG